MISADKTFELDNAYFSQISLTYQKIHMLKQTIIWVIVFCFFHIFVLEGKVSGHSHVWIHNAVIVHFDKDGMAGFKQEWVFDEMFSNMIIHDFDKNRNGEFDPTEVQEVFKGAFSNLKKFEYFTHVKIDGKPFKVKFVKDFNAKIVKNRIVYHFFVPCHIKATSSYKEIRIGIYDESFYTSVTLLKDQIFFESDEGYDHHYKVELNKNEPYYYGQVYPEEIVLKFQKK
jgi:ABC-type uncharacterized transport system substrate-binding protein